MLDRLNLSLGKVVLRQVREFWWVYLLALGAMFCTHRFQVELPFVAKELGELVLASRMQEIPYAQYLLIALGIVFFRTLSRVFFFWPARVLQGNLQEELAMHLEQAPPWRYQSYSSGQIYQCLVTDIMNMRGFIGFGLLQVGNIIIAMGILVPRLVEFNPQLLVAFLPLLICMIIFFLVTTFSQKFYRKMMDLQGDVQNFIIESYQGKKTVKNFQAESSFGQLFERRCQRELQTFFKTAMGSAVSIPLAKLGVGLTFLWGAGIIYREDLGSTALILFSGFVFLFQGPLMFASWVGVVISRTVGSWQRIKEMVRDLQRESREEARVVAANPSREDRHCHLPFWEGQLSLPFHPHSWNVIVGETGVGKTTLLKRYATLLSARGEKISYVAQEPYLYSDTVQNNIFLGRRAGEGEIAQARQLLGVFQLGMLAENVEAVMALQVGENGKRVSGGQAKRICLIRSIMSESEVLIWDDPFSSVDIILERRIVGDLRKGELSSRTVVLTAHRLSTVGLCDQAFYIDQRDGLLESGPVANLLLKDKSKLYEYLKQQMV